MQLIRPELAILIVSLLLFLAVLASKTSGRLGVPSLVLFMILGWAFGSHGLGIICVDPLTQSHTWLEHVGVIALSLILFSGGLDTKFSEVRPVVWRSATLATLGVFLTAAITAVAAYFVLDFTPAQSFLMGAIISSTDAAAVFAVLRSKGVGLKHRLKPLLEFESGSNDPMAMLLTTIGIAWVTGEMTNPLQLGATLVLNLAVGAGFGVLIGWLTQKLMNKLTLPYDGLFTVLMLAIALFTHIGSELLMGNGLLAAYCCGIVLGDRPFIHKQSIMKFFDGLSWIMQIVIFVALGLVLNPQDMFAHAYEGIVIALVLMFVARLVAVYLCHIPFRGVSHREKIFTSWVGLKGAAPLVFAIMPFAAIGQGGMTEATAVSMVNIVYFVVLLSVLVQGTTLPLCAKLCKVDLPSPEATNYPLQLENRVNFQSQMQEVVLPADCHAVGKPLVDLNLPTDSLIVLISRGDEFIMPNGSTKLKAFDKLLVLATTSSDLEGVYHSLGLDIPETT